MKLRDIVNVVCDGEDLPNCDCECVKQDLFGNDIFTWRGYSNCPGTQAPCRTNGSDVAYVDFAFGDGPSELDHTTHYVMLQWLEDVVPVCDDDHSIHDFQLCSKGDAIVIKLPESIVSELIQICLAR
ncbi:uncharacterized protein [Amphiura filiformis]|uniref:uncharacterized protein n=1 Tax=Amphiura filiformis TaxID=82378 RepID=UPI003B221544